MMTRQERVPAFAVGLGDLEVLRTVITSYLTLVYRTVPPSRKRDEEIVLLQGVQRRISALPANALDAQIPLYELEVPALDKALSGFMAFVRRKVPPSHEREEALRDLERFRRQLMATMR